jgi:hypothetical protein
MRVNRKSQASTNGQHAAKQRDDTNGAAPQAHDDHEPTEGPGPEPDVLKVLLKQFRELGEYFSYYVSAKTDSVKLSLRNVILWMVLAALGFVAVVALMVTASWLLLIGIAEGLSALCGDRSWAGNLMTGVLVLAGLGLATYYTLAKRARCSRERTVEKYENCQARQQARFGHDVAEQAAATTADKK